MTVTRSRFLAGAAALAVAALAGPAVPQEPPLDALRGGTPIPQETPADVYRMERHDRAIPRNYAQQPPVIPHNIKGYQITKNVNTCMVCHSSKSAPRTGATPVAKSHYIDRDGNVLPTISTRRYFCLQCHAPQFDAEPLVPNTFKPAS